MDKCKPHIDTIDKKRTSFAQELMKDEEERRHMKEKLESDKNDEDFKQQVDDMIEERFGKIFDWVFLNLSFLNLFLFALKRRGEHESRRVSME